MIARTARMRRYHISMRYPISTCAALLGMTSIAALAQNANAPAQAAKPPASEVAGIHVNYDEALAGNYKLPDPLVLANGKPVRDEKTWTEKRRPELIRLFDE